MKFFSKSKSKSKSKLTVALCLGGGGARGFAHIGAIKAFEENGIDFDMCVGTSVGSILGALYCAGVKSDEMMRVGDALDMKEIHNGVIFAPNDPMKIGRIVTGVIGDAEIENLPKKFAAVAVDLKQGKQVVLDKGKVSAVCSASCCVPLFFRPVVYNDKHLVDGGLLNNIPSDVCRMLGADKVVSVDINPTRGSGTNELGLIDVLKATFSIMSSNSSIMGIKHSDILIAADTSKFRSTSKLGYEEMTELGYKAALEQINDIKKLINGSEKTYT